MNVIRHQAVGVNRTTILKCQLTQMRQVDQIVGVAAKAHGTIYAALNDM
jgi:hypothetical protein